MQKLLALPVVAPLLFGFGIVMSDIGYTYLHRGSFQYMPQNGPIQFISPMNRPAMYWSTSAGLLGLGLLLLLLSIYAALVQFRACRADTAAANPLQRYGKFAFTIVFMLLAAFITCSHHRHA